MRPIEPFIRETAAPTDALAIRGGPLTVEKLMAQAADEQRRHSWAGLPFVAVSVFCTVDGWDADAILSGPLVTRSSFSAVSVGSLRTSGFEVIATYRSPHFDVVLPRATVEAATTLLSVFGDPRPNPHRRRR